MVEITNVKVHDLKQSIIASGYAMRTEPYNYDEEGLDMIKHIERVKNLVKAGGGSGHPNFRTGILVSFDIKYPQYFSLELQRYHWIQIVTSQSKMHRLLKIDIDKACNKYVDERSIEVVNDLIYTYNLIANEAKDRNFRKVPFELELRSGEIITSYTKDDALYSIWMQILSSCPLGLELTMRVSTNYEQLATIYRQRDTHKLKEDWGAFCKFIRSLPFAKDLIICK